MKIINLFGGPGVGKSTTAAGIFFEMKRAGYLVELVTEYAKELVWQNDTYTLDNQLYILAKQENRLRKLVGKVDYVVTDCPLLMAEFYLKRGAVDASAVRSVCLDMFNTYDNINYFLVRDKKYVQHGRLHTEAEARGCCIEIEAMCNTLWNISYTKIVGDSLAHTAIVEDINL
tara:strand:- start:12252 stop:12770 length:519 start_codon:yes stop_codon:yes gene_type:complete